MQPSFLSRGPIEIIRFFVWRFASPKSFKIIEVGSEDKFNEGDMPKAERDAVRIILRACKSGQPDIKGNRITVEGKCYTTL